MSSDLSLDELRAAAIAARDKAKVDAVARNDRVLKTALGIIVGYIKATPNKRWTVDTDTDLPKPEVKVAFINLATHDDAFTHLDVARLAAALPSGFTLKTTREHAFQCDCGQDKGCTDFVVVMWSW